MDTSKPGTEATAQATVSGNTRGREGRRRRWEMSGEHIRYFLPRPGSPASKPELGAELKTKEKRWSKRSKPDRPFSQWSRGRLCRR